MVSLLKSIIGFTSRDDDTTRKFFPEVFLIQVKCPALELIVAINAFPVAILNGSFAIDAMPHDLTCFFDSVYVVFILYIAHAHGWEVSSGV